MENGAISLELNIRLFRKFGVATSSFVVLCLVAKIKNANDNKHVHLLL